MAGQCQHTQRQCQHNAGQWLWHWVPPGKPAPAPAQPLRGHILPALPTASVRGCLTVSASAAVCSILFSPHLIPQMCICVPMYTGNGILSVTITRVTGLRCRLQRYHLNKKGEKRCIPYLFVHCLKEGKKDFSHMNKGSVAVFRVTSLCGSKTCSQWENEICHLWQSVQPRYLL